MRWVISLWDPKSSHNRKIAVFAESRSLDRIKGTRPYFLAFSGSWNYPISQYSLIMLTEIPIIGIKLTDNRNQTGPTLVITKHLTSKNCLDNSKTFRDLVLRHMADPPIKQLWKIRFLAPDPSQNPFSKCLSGGPGHQNASKIVHQKATPFKHTYAVIIFSSSLTKWYRSFGSTPVTIVECSL